MAMEMRKEGLPVDEDYIFEVSGVPKQDDAEDTPKEEGEGKAKEEKPPEDKKPDKKEETATKAEEKLSDDRNFMLQLFDKTFGRFFAVAPTMWSGAYQNLKANWTRRITGSIKLSDDYSIDIDRLVREAISEVYANKGSELINPKLFSITNDAQQHGIDTSLAGNDIDDKFVKQFKENAAVFSAFKNHQQTKEIAALMLDEKGQLVPFHRFKKAALCLSEKYNEQYLRAEYSTAVRAAQMAANLKHFEKNIHLYPNLEYIESNAAHKREQHLAFVGTILPFHHEAWDWMMPPSGWGCDCSVRPTDKEVTGVPLKPSDFKKLFAGNPAKTAEFVDAKETPYYKHTDQSLRKKVTNEGIRLTKEEAAEEELYKGQKGGYVKIVPQNKNEREKNLTTYKLMADNGGKYTLLKESKEEGVQNPDAFNYKTGMFSDAKHPETNDGKRAIQNAIDRADTQGVGEVIIHFDRQYLSKDLYNGLKAALQKGQALELRTIVLIRTDAKIMTFDVEKLRVHFAKKKK